MPPIDVVGSEQEIALVPLIEDTCPDEDEIPTATPGGNASERAALVSPSSWEKTAALLRSVPYFTTPEPPAPGVEAFYHFFQRHFVELRGEPYLVGVVHPSRITPEFALRCTHPLLKYTTEEMAKIVRLSPFVAQVCLTAWL